MTIWFVSCFFIQIAAAAILDNIFFIGKTTRLIINIGVLLLFVTFSYMAGKETVKYVTNVFNIVISGLFDNFLDYLLAEGTINTPKKAMIWIELYNVTIVVLCVLFYFLLLSGYLFLVSRKFLKKSYPLQTYENIFLILPCAAALCISIILQMIIITIENGMTIIIFDRFPSTKFWVPAICFLLLSTVIASVILFQKQVQYNEEAGKCAILENQVLQMQKEITEIQDIYADMRGLRHDMRNHLSSITSFIRNFSDIKSKTLEGYIGKMEETVSRLDFTYRTGNLITDIIIHQKGQEAEKKQIQLKVDFSYPLKFMIDVYDVAVILNNALENAIEACDKGDGAKQIKLRSYVKGSLFFIEVENEFFDDIIIEEGSGLPISSKRNGKLHGIGISNIQRCAKNIWGILI